MKAKTLFQWAVLMILVFTQAFNGFPALASPVSATLTRPIPPNNFFQWPWPLEQSWRITQGPHAIDNSLSGLDMNQKAIPWDSTDIQEVRAAADGTVTFASSCYVVIDHGNGWSTGYLHIHTQVGPGPVKANDKIGHIETNKNAAQCEGVATAPHLHFRLIYNNINTSIIGATFGGWTVNVEKGYTPTNNKRSFYTKNGETKYIFELLDNSSPASISCPSPNTTFCDVPKDHPRYAAIEAGYQYGLFSGVLVNIGGVQRRFFYPSDALLRQHGVIIVAHWLYFYSSPKYAWILPPVTGIFPDVTGDSETSRVIEMFYRDGGTVGFSDRTFKPLIAATRKDFIYFVMRILLKHIPITNATCTFSDTNDITIRKACDLGLVKGENGAFSPDEPLSRELAALIACRAFIATTNTFIKINQCGDTKTVNAQLIVLRNNAREPHSSKYLCFTAPINANGKIPGVNITSDGMVLNYEYASHSYKVGCPIKNSLLAGKIIAINPGHGYYYDNFGKLSYSGANVSGVIEDELNYDMASKLYQGLIENSADALLLREPDKSLLMRDKNNWLDTIPWWKMGTREYAMGLDQIPSWVWDTASSGKAEDRDTNARPFLANEWNAEIMVSIHNNSSITAPYRYKPEGGCGTLILYSDTNSRKSQSLALANMIQMQLQSLKLSYNWWCGARVVKGSEYTSPRPYKPGPGYGENNLFYGPAVLIEFGNLGNDTIREKIQDTTFQQSAMDNIRDGISNYFLSLSSLCPTSFTWRVEYWSNSSLDGNRALCKAESNINYDWGSGSPSGLPADRFSLRATSTQYFTAGAYRFHLSGDDGVRLWLDGYPDAIIDQWKNPNYTDNTYEVNLSEGKHSLMLEYQEDTGRAGVKLWWESACPPEQYYAEYYNNRTLSGRPTFTRCENGPINSKWGSDRPDNRIGKDNFSVRWTGQAYINAGTYDFIARADDGVRVWLDDSLIIDQWKDQPATEHRTTRTVTAGIHTIKLEYYEHKKNAFAQFRWEPKATPAKTLTSTPPTLAVTVTRTISPTITFTPTNTLSSPYTPTPTPFPVVETDTPSPTPTATTTDTPTTVVEPPTDTPTPTPTETPTITPTLTPTKTRTPTPTITRTPTPTKTPVPDVLIMPRNYTFNWSTSGANIASQNTVSCSSNPDYTRVLYWRTTDTGGWVNWTPNFQVAGFYTIYVYIPDYTHTSPVTTKATYYLNETVWIGTVDQNQNKCGWISLGRYYFGQGNISYVHMSVQTSESPFHLIAADGMKFVWTP